MNKLLIVDDDASIRLLFRRVVAGSGWDILEAGDGETALETIRSDLPTVVLLDLAIPPISGAEVCRRIKADPELRSTIVVMMAAFSDHRYREQCRAAGADRILIKPLSAMALHGLLGALLLMEWGCGTESRPTGPACAEWNRLSSIGESSRQADYPVSVVLITASSMSTRADVRRARRVVGIVPKLRKSGNSCPVRIRGRRIRLRVLLDAVEPPGVDRLRSAQVNLELEFVICRFAHGDVGANVLRPVDVRHNERQFDTCVRGQRLIVLSKVRHRVRNSVSRD